MGPPRILPRCLQDAPKTPASGFNGSNFSSPAAGCWFLVFSTENGKNGQKSAFRRAGGGDFLVFKCKKAKPGRIGFFGTRAPKGKRGVRGLRFVLLLVGGWEAAGATQLKWEASIGCGEPYKSFCALLSWGRLGCLSWLVNCRQRPYRVECTGSLPNSEVKRRRARLVLGWGTAREDLRVLLAFCGVLFHRCCDCVIASSLRSHRQDY